MRRIATIAVALATGLGTAGVAYAAFSSSTTNPQTVKGGTLTLSDEDGGTRAFGLTGLTPASTAENRCLRVRYLGTKAATVRMYGNASGALAPYLRLVVTRGTQPAVAFPACTSFVPAATVYDGTLAAYPSTWASGLPAAPGAWTSGTDHVYRVTISLDNDAAAQGKSGSAAFSWEAR